MNLEKLYKMQAELDRHILQKHNIKMTKEELLDNTILALLVEVGELANTTRCFKHWSTKGMMEKEIILDELADVWHFYLSIGNQTEERFKTITLKSMEEAEGVIQASEINLSITREILIVKIFLDIYLYVSKMEYTSTGKSIRVLGLALGFTDEEVEQAYLKKHEENYRRQREGY